MLYRSTDARRRAGAFVKYPLHGASIHSADKIAPSTPGSHHGGVSGNARAEGVLLESVRVLDDWLANWNGPDLRYGTGGLPPPVGGEGGVVVPPTDEHLIGTSGADRLVVGGQVDAVVEGLGGNDVLTGGRTTAF